MIANKKKEVLAVLTITISVALLTVGGLWISGKRTAGFFTWGSIDAREQAPIKQNAGDGRRQCDFHIGAREERGHDERRGAHDGRHQDATG